MSRLREAGKTLRAKVEDYFGYDEEAHDNYFCFVLGHYYGTTQECVRCNRPDYVEDLYNRDHPTMNLRPDFDTWRWRFNRWKRETFPTSGCSDCGKYTVWMGIKMGDHSNCDDIPF